MYKVLTTARGTITIRAGTVEDAEALYDLRLEALASQAEAFAADHDLTRDQGVEAWVERVRQNEAGNEGIINGAWAEDQLVGMTGLYRGHWPKTQHSGLIWGVYVREGWRRQGVAEALLEACLAWARAQGMTVVKLGVVTSNMGAIRCYARSGFAVYGIEPQTLCHDGVFYDELLMAKAI
jgi:RimJ/RimL family protein N-acetyltransferase